MDQISASIRAFGFTNPVLIDPDGSVIAGHGRLQAAKAAGPGEVPTIALAGLSDAQKRALRLADNRIALGAGWDLELLKLELAKLSAMDVDLDLSLTGFSTGEIDVILKGPADPDDEIIPAVRATPRTRPGEIQVLGEHRIGCGDGREVDAAFLDPPCNVRIGGHANVRGRHREFAMASGEMSEEAFRALLAGTLGPCARVSRDGAVHFVCIDWRHMDDVAAVGRGVCGDRLNLRVWNKSNAGMGSLCRSKHELVFVYRVGDAPHVSAVELGRPRGRRNEPACEPVPGQMVTIRVDGVEPRVTAAEAFLLHVTRPVLEGDSAAAGAAMAAIEEARASRPRAVDEQALAVTTVFATPGSVNSALEPLRMVRKLDRYRANRARALSSSSLPFSTRLQPPVVHSPSIIQL